MLSRRKFLLSSALVAGGGVAGFYLYRSSIGSPREQAVEEVVTNLASLPGAIRYGKKFRQLQQTKRFQMATVGSISDSLYDAHGEFNRENISEILDRQIQIELRENIVYLVDDWYLARIEADLCALASLHSGV